MHAKTMLLVDDRQSELAERDFILEKGVRADGERRFSRSDVGERLFPLLFFQAAGEPDHFDVQRCQPCGELAVMLLRENFSRGHDRRLVARLDGLQRGQRRDDGLAAANVTLQQALHRMRARQVRANLREHAKLCPGQFKGHCRQQGPRLVGILQQRMRAYAVAPFVMQTHRQLLRQQLIKFDPAPGRMGPIEQGLPVGVRRRVVQHADRFIERQQFEFLDHRLGQGVRKVGLRQRARGEFAQDFLTESRGRRIDRRQRLRQWGFPAQYAKAWVHHLRAEESLANLAHQAHFRPGCQRVLLARIEIEKTHHQPPAAVVDLRNELTAGSELDLRFDHRTLDLHSIARQCFVDGDDAGLVFVAQWQMRDQIGQLANADAREFFPNGWCSEL